MKKGTLLLVDDDRHVLSSMADWLREQGYKVDVALDYAAAVAAVERKPYDLLLVDIRLPDRDGFEVLSFSRGEIRPRPSFCLPVMALSKQRLKRFAPVRSIC